MKLAPIHLTPQPKKPIFYRVAAGVYKRRSLPEGCEFYFKDVDGTYRRVIELRDQYHSRKVLGYIPGERTLKIVTLDWDQPLTVTDLPLDGQTDDQLQILATETHRQNVLAA